MEYKEALDFIHGTYAFGIKLGLDNIGKLLEYMDNPQDKLKFVHIAGTNGKGSTSNMISNVLKHSGYKVGLFISPFLEEFTERIQINGTQISKESLGRVTGFVKESIDKMIENGFPHPSEFEVVTAIGFQYFYEERVDIVTLEVGMGGRFDATNIIKKPEIAIITSIALDHMQYLGNTIEEITFEKAGIIKENGDVVLYPQGIKIENQIRQICIDRNAVFHTINSDLLKIKSTSLSGQELSYAGGKNLSAFNFILSLLGKHQVANCITAMSAIELLIDKGYSISENSIQNAMATIQFPGRFEVLSLNPTIIIDGAHNENGIDSLVNTVKTYIDKKIVLILGVLADKDFDPMIQKLLEVTSKIYTVTPNNPRAKSSEELAEHIKNNHPEIDVQALDSISDGANIAIKGSREDIYVFVGSLYMIGDARSAVRSLQKKI
ncbi:bifunctional folylpolyglutamate synthase/dihydrofolate synthase [Alkalibaculum sp. M08DMB]|uniref:tetrahydrofolate synthase n=1 Tax=Alkalibaculum sporogenes TaxID=2655001 RepID=A0A6A7KBP5_9FIRM|nr:folylpolyglutamate synthase/dihydrofolate synthase family protein [Alkalibaculum sporogenes]MPW26938.1 bifunctional folylpolyglutamate synthase/dihydrofolate synthase [Alkalibaculum sporogenes]